MMMMIVITTPKVKMNLHKIQLDVTYKCLIKWIINIDKQIYKSILNKLNTYFWVGLLNYCGSVFKKVKHEDCIYIYDISVFPTWHLYLWHQCFSDMTSIFMTSVFFRHDIYIYDISVFHMTSTFMRSVYFTCYQMKTISSTDGCQRQRTHSRIGV